MAEAWTGVMREKPIDATASRVHCDNDGVRPSHALEDEDDLGAIFDQGDIRTIAQVDLRLSPIASRNEKKSVID